MATKKRTKVQRLNVLTYIFVIVILILIYLYIAKPSQIILQKNNSSVISNQQGNTEQLQSQITQLQSENQNLTSQLQNIQKNQKTPIIANIYQNKEVVLPPFTNSIEFYNSTYNLYNNYTTPSSQNYTFNVKYNGYLIIKIQNISEQYFNIKPPIGSFALQVYSQSLTKYIQYNIPAPTCSYIQGYGYYCSNNTAVDLGWTLYPQNYSAKYLAPVEYGNVTITLTNTNNYPIQMDFSVTYVGENYTNLMPIILNYSN